MKTVSFKVWKKIMRLSKEEAAQEKENWTEPEINTIRAIMSSHLPPVVLAYRFHDYCIGRNGGIDNGVIRRYRDWVVKQNDLFDQFPNLITLTWLDANDRFGEYVLFCAELEKRIHRMLRDEVV